MRRRLVKDEQYKTNYKHEIKRLEHATTVVYESLSVTSSYIFCNRTEHAKI